MFHVYPHTCIVISGFGALEMHLYIILLCALCSVGLPRLRSCWQEGFVVRCTGLISGHNKGHWHSPGQHVSVLV